LKTPLSLVEIDPGLYPNLASFAEHVHTPPSFAQFIAQGQGFLDKALKKAG